MSFKHWISISTLTPSVTPCFSSTARRHECIGEEKFYLQCLVSNIHEAPFCSLYTTPKIKGIQSLTWAPWHYNIYFNTNYNIHCQQVSIILWKKSGWSSLKFTSTSVITPNFRKIPAFADRNWRVRSAVTQSLKNKKEWWTTLNTLEIAIWLKCLFSLFNCHYLYYHGWGAYWTLHCTKPEKIVQVFIFMSSI